MSGTDSPLATSKEQNSTANQTTTSQIPEWVQRAGAENYQKASGIADQPFVPYTGERTPALNPQYGAADSWMMSKIGQGQNYVGQAGTTYGDLANINIRAGQFKNQDIAPYLNPYITNVENRALDALERSRGMAINSVGSAAVGADAFGGTRHGIQEGVTNAESIRAAGDLSAGLRKEGFDVASGLLTGDLDRKLQAQLGEANIRLGAAGGLESVGKTTSDLNARDYFQMISSADRNQGVTNQQAANDYEQYLAAQQWPIQGVNLATSTLGMTPYNKTETGSKTGNVTSTASPDYITALMGGMKLAGLF